MIAFFLFWSLAFGFLAVFGRSIAGFFLMRRISRREFYYQAVEFWVGSGMFFVAAIAFWLQVNDFLG